ncbi:hypothetical protein EMIT0P44_510016 [Pseudomonas sp. IT-P44]
MSCFTCAKALTRKEKLHFHAHIWYKVSRSERVSYNGITPASQADNEGSIPFTRSTIFKASSAVHGHPIAAGDSFSDSCCFCAGVRFYHPPP